jgi:hypothetical protein
MAGDSLGRSAEIARPEHPLDLTDRGEAGYAPELCTRPLELVLQEHVQGLRADAILAGDVARGQHARVDFEDGAFRVTSWAAEPERLGLSPRLTA